MNKGQAVMSRDELRDMYSFEDSFHYWSGVERERQKRKEHNRLKGFYQEGVDYEHRILY